MFLQGDRDYFSPHGNTHLLVYFFSQSAFVKGTNYVRIVSIADSYC